MTDQQTADELELDRQRSEGERARRLVEGVTLVGQYLAALGELERLPRVCAVAVSERFGRARVAVPANAVTGDGTWLSADVQISPHGRDPGALCGAIAAWARALKADAVGAKYWADERTPIVRLEVSTDAGGVELVVWDHVREDAVELARELELDPEQAGAYDAPGQPIDVERLEQIAGQ